MTDDTKLMIADATKLAESKSGYRYNPAKLAELIDLGLFGLPCGDPIVRRGDQYLVYTGGEVVSYKVAADGIATENKRTRVTPQVLRGLIIQHAVEASAL